MNKSLFILLLVFLFIECRNKKIKLTDDDTVVIADFIDFFPVVSLPFQVFDSILIKKQTDSASIGYKIFTQFVPDSILTNEFGKGVKPDMYPLGKVVVDNLETYLFLKATTTSKKCGYILAFDKKNKFIAGMPLVVADKDAATYQSGGIDAKHTVSKTLQKKDDEGQISESKNVYILNAEARAFSLIMMDEGVADQHQEIINPIDTFPQNNKFAGDYSKDKRNYVSVRDGKNPSLIVFFIHFEKDNGECAGELKGEATMQGVKNAVFRANGNPCVIEFTFTKNAILVKELEACGSYRDIKCFFEGSYRKAKELKVKTSAKKQA
ncbi:MAG: hypothetical protein WKF97_17100 [Chitinophagaceae bacterium]